MKGGRDASLFVYNGFYENQKCYKSWDTGIFKKNYVCIKEGDKNTHHPCQCLDWEIPPGVLTFLTGEGEEQ